MTTLTEELHLLWRAFISVAYKNECLVCDRPLTLHDTAVCGACLESIEPLPQPLCPRCALPVALWPAMNPDTPLTRYTAAQVCPNCHDRLIHYHRIHCLFLLNKTARTIMHEIKFKKKHWLINALRTRIRRAATFLGDRTFDLVVPVPLSFARELTRGFNQAQIIAAELAAMTGSPIASHVIVRTTRLHQSHLGRKDRLTNLQQTFNIRTPAAVRGKRILLVDDVLTTGSTLNACAACLQNAGAHEIEALALFRAF